MRHFDATPARARAICVWAVCAQGWGAAACADWLNIPDAPHLAEPSASAQLQANQAPEPRSIASAASGSSVPDSKNDRAGDTVVAAQPLDPDAAVRSSASGDPDIGGGTESGSPAVTVSGRDAGANPAPVAAGAEPQDAASTLPACAGGESAGPNGNCFAVVTVLLAWPDARATCVSRGTGWDLAAVHDVEINRFLAGLITGETWIGGSDADVEGTWRWVRDDVAFWRGSGLGTALNRAYNNWNSDEPNGDGDSDCVRMIAQTARWADLECEELRGAICEGPAP